MAGKIFQRGRGGHDPKNLLGVADLFVDKLNTEMQTAGTSKASGNQQLQKMQLFLQSLLRRRNETGSLEPGRQTKLIEHNFYKSLKDMRRDDLMSKHPKGQVDAKNIYPLLHTERFTPFIRNDNSDHAKSGTRTVALADRTAHMNPKH